MLWSLFLMTDHDWDHLESLINHKIRLHEMRVAAISGVLGLILTAGTFHAIYLNHLAAQ